MGNGPAIWFLDVFLHVKGSGAVFEQCLFTC